MRTGYQAAAAAFDTPEPVPVPSAASVFASREPRRPQAPRRRGAAVPVLGGLLAVTAAWAAVTSAYLVFHDDWMAGLLNQQRAMQTDYEDRVGTLQRQVDREAAERRLARSGVERRLAALVERQALIETRQGLLADISGAAPPAMPATARAGGAVAAKPVPEFGGLRMRGSERPEPAEGLVDAELGGLEARLEDATTRQSRAASGIAARARRRAERYRTTLMRVGLSPERFDARPAGVGGPLVPVSGDPFDLALAEAARSTAQERRLSAALRALPFRKPITEDFAYSSGFGTRLDPFTRGLALHTGVDMRADYGAAARATAPGRVTVAEYSGGYGNMVELDHGNGVSTRYAHLAAFAVAPGQRVEAGAVVGRVGSTGRSTGSHLHYETRIDGEPVDPQAFLHGADLVDPDAN